MKKNKIMFIGNFILYMIIGGLAGGLAVTLFDSSHKF